MLRVYARENNKRIYSRGLKIFYVRKKTLSILWGKLWLMATFNKTDYETAKMRCTNVVSIVERGNPYGYSQIKTGKYEIEKI